LTFTKLPYGSLEGAEKLEQLRVLEHGFKIKVVETQFDSIEVDLPEDVEVVEKNFPNQKALGSKPRALSFVLRCRPFRFIHSFLLTFLLRKNLHFVRRSSQT